MNDAFRSKGLLIVGIIGLIISSVSGLAEHVPWLQSLCAGISDGCRETAEVTLLKLPLWIWGVGFYVVLILAVFFLKQWLIWLVSAAVGAEVALMWIMFSMKVFCTFCMINLLVVLLLAVFTLKRDRFWQTLSMGLAAFLFLFVAVPYENNIFASPVDPKAPEGVAATVGGETITMEQLVTPLSSQLYGLEREAYRLKRERLDQMVIEMLLQKEAKARGVTLEQFVNSVVLAGGVNVEETEIDAYYEENREQLGEWKGPPEELRSRIRVFLQQQKQYQKVRDFSKSLEPKYAVAIHLKEPVGVHTRVSLEGMSIGPADAPVTVVEFSDYQCPACRQVHDTVKKVREVYKGQIRWVFRDYPLKRHKDAKRAAEAARCAGEQNKFWEYQDVLYSSEEEFTAEQLEQYARQLGLTPDPFRQCLQSGKYGATIEKDLQEAKNAGIDRTPTFVINGQLMTGGLSFERFKEIIDEELKKAEKKS
jgi:protein-disulfide isomerase